MSKSKYIRSGFTLLELCVVIAILSILATLAVLNYSKHRVDEYDQEALADIHSIYQQASQALSDWSIASASDDFHISQGCVGSTTTLDFIEEHSVYYKDQNTPPHENEDNWIRNAIELPDGLHHWRYNVCFGWVDVIVGSNHVPIPSFIIAASRFTGNEINGEREVRYILHGSGIDSPIIGITLSENNFPALPESLALTTPAVASFSDIQ